MSMCSSIAATMLTGELASEQGAAFSGRKPLMSFGVSGRRDRPDIGTQIASRAPCWRTYRNISHLLASEGATWHDVVRTTCYLRDIERDYEEFNNVRTEFYSALGLDPFPASTGIQARICRSDLLVEIEALAIMYRNQVE